MRIMKGMMKGLGALKTLGRSPLMLAPFLGVAPQRIGEVSDS